MAVIRAALRIPNGQRHLRRLRLTVAHHHTEAFAEA
jgi:hypothetical protein